MRCSVEWSDASKSKKQRKRQNILPFFFSGYVVYGLAVCFGTLYSDTEDVIENAGGKEGVRGTRSHKTRAVEDEKSVGKTKGKRKVMKNGKNTFAIRGEAMQGA
jgi:hypothetical protein